jgi:hypothetical protein
VVAVREVVAGQGLSGRDNSLGKGPPDREPPVAHARSRKKLLQGRLLAGYKWPAHSASDISFSSSSIRASCPIFVFLLNISILQRFMDAMHNTDWRGYEFTMSSLDNALEFTTTVAGVLKLCSRTKSMLFFH